MKPLGRVILLGAIAVVLFDAAASVASRSLGFPYPSASYGSYLIYGVTGFFAAKSGGWKGAILAGLALGLVDASIGWAISWAIGPGRPPEGTPFTLWMWPAVAVMVCITAIICALIGGAIARVTRPKSAA